MKCYHVTPKKNIFNIMSEGIKTGPDGCIYLCKNEDDCFKFFTINPANKGKQFAVLTIDLSESEVEESFDHDKKYIDCKAYIYREDIPANKIPQNLVDIPLYTLC